MLGPQTAATLASWPIAYVSAVPAVEQLQTKLQLVPLTVFFRLTVKIKKNKKKFYYANGLYVCLITMLITGSAALWILLSVFR